MRAKRLAGHLAVRYFCVALAALLVLAWYATAAFDDALNSSTWIELEAAANLAASDAGAKLESDREAAIEAARHVAESTRNQITLVNADGHILFDSREPATLPDTAADRPEITAALVGKTSRESRVVRNERWLYVAVPVRGDGKTVGAVCAARSAVTNQRASHEALKSLLFGLVVIAPIAGLVGWWLSRRTARRLRAAAARRLPIGV